MDELERQKSIAAIAEAADTTVEIIEQAIQEQCQEMGMDFDELVLTHLNFVKTSPPGFMAQLKALYRR